MSGQLRVGIAGAGVMASSHTLAWHGTGDVVTSYYTPTGVRRPPEADQQAVATGDLEAFLHSVDVVDICSPTPTHLDLAVATADAGRPLLCEKPLARTAGEARVVAAAFAARGLPLAVGHLLRFDPVYVTAARELRAGRIGDLVALRLARISADPSATRPWFADQARSGGIVLDLMIHDLDLAGWLAGQVSRVRGLVSDRAPHTAAALLQHENGVLTRVDASWSMPFPHFHAEFQAIGTRGVLSTDPGGRLVLETRDSVVILAEPAPLAESMLRQVAAFHATVAGAPHQGATAEEAVAAVALAERVAASALAD